MKPSKNKMLLTLLVASACAFTSCKDEYNICDQNRLITLNGGFFTVSGGMAVPVSVPNLTINNINGASVIANAPNSTAFSLSLNDQIDSSKFVFTLSTGLQSDTVTFFYSNQTVEISPSCGNVIVQNLRSVRSTINTIDSVRISNASVTNRLAQNVRVFY